MNSSDPAASRRQRGQSAARDAGLRYVKGFTDGITRRRCGRGFMYFTPHGRHITSEGMKQRLRELAVPPAWEDVWICPDPRGHIQATGIDDSGRRQYLYHEDWRAVSESTKYERMALMAAVLPRIRRRVRRDLGRSGVDRQRLVAAIVRLLDRTQIRIGSQAYLEDHGTHGATTLASEHVELSGVRISLAFPAKGQKTSEVEFTDPKVAEVISRCQELDEQFLFSYDGGSGEYRPVNSTDVNDYLRRTTGESITAKDFRTWWGTVAALSVLVELGDVDSVTRRREALDSALTKAAEALGNSKEVCRDSYVHPGLISAFEQDEFAKLVAEADWNTDSRPPAKLSVHEWLLRELLPALADFACP